MTHSADAKSFEIPIDKLGYPGISGSLVATFSPMQLKNAATGAYTIADQSERDFELKCALAKVQTYIKNINFDLGPENGGSFFKIPPNAKVAKLQTDAGEYEFIRNSSNEISLISGKVKTTSFSKACELFFSAVSPFLDYIAFCANTPLLIDTIVCRDTKNGAVLASYIAPYQDVEVRPHLDMLPIEMLPVFSLYREAKNSDSCYYKFLCYYKILEGIYATLRPMIFDQAKKAGIQISTVKEIIPSHPELVKFKKEYIGQPIKKLFDNEFTEEYRNAVAHFGKGDGGWTYLSNYAIRAKYSNIILAIELSCRVVIETQLNYFKQVRPAS